MQNSSEFRNFRHSEMQDTIFYNSVGSTIPARALPAPGAKVHRRNETVRRLGQPEALLPHPRGQRPSSEYTRTLSQLNLGQDHQITGLSFFSRKDSSGDKVPKAAHEKQGRSAE